VNTVRAAHIFAADPNDDDPEEQKRRRLFCVLKVNNAPKMKALAYRIVKPDTDFGGPYGTIINPIPHVEWLGEVDTTADQAVNQEKKHHGPQLQVAVDWLIEQFIVRRAWPRDLLIGNAHKEKISRTTLYRCLDKLAVQGMRNKDTGVYEWFVLEDWKPPYEDAPISW
jgi:hypothetical protein